VLDILTTEKDGAILKKKKLSAASKKKDAPSSSKKKDASFLKNKSNIGVSALLVQQSEDWRMKVAARFMGVRKKEEELLDPHND
jgi:hypothetical protein